MVEDEQRAELGNAFMIALTHLRDDYRQATQIITETVEAQEAFDSATSLADTLRQLAEQAAELRAQAAERIATEEKLSLAVLATRIGVSKARAAQLIQTAKENNITASAETQESSDA
jgi:regulator of replication initiation timing